MLKTFEEKFNEAEEFIKRCQNRIDSFDLNATIDDIELDTEIQKINERHEQMMKEIKEEQKMIEAQVEIESLLRKMIGLE